MGIPDLEAWNAHDLLRPAMPQDLHLYHLETRLLPRCGSADESPCADKEFWLQQAGTP